MRQISCYRRRPCRRGDAREDSAGLPESPARPARCLGAGRHALLRREGALSQNVDDSGRAPQNLVDKFSCRLYGDAAQVRKTRTGPGTANPAAPRCGRVLFYGIGGENGRSCPSAGQQAPRSEGSAPNAKKAPGASTRTSLHGSEEPPDTFSAGLPRRAPHTVSNPKVRTTGSPLQAALPVHVPEGPLSGCRLARRLPGSRPRRPKPPGRSAFDPVPRARLSGSSADRPKAFAASATGFLAVTHRVNGYCFAPAAEATKNYTGSSKFRWITK